MSRRSQPIDGQLDLLGTAPDSSGAPPPDHEARQRIAGSLGETLFVEAGAGAGKTTSLAGRIVALVREGVPIGAIAAITFTEKAAAELRTKTREMLAEQAAGAAASPEGRSRLAEGLDNADAAPIGTLHAFAGRLLREFPVEAGLPPGFTVLDEVASDLAFEERWATHVLDLLDDPARAGVVLYARRDGLGVDGLKRLARAFGDGWDLVRERVEQGVAEPPPPDLGGFVGRLERLVADTEPPEGDRVAQRLEMFADRARFLRASAADPLVIFDFPKDGLFSVAHVGSKEKWKRVAAGEAGLHAFRAAAGELAGEWQSMSHRARDAWHLAVGACLARFTMHAANDRRERGQLEFHDLLVLARDLIAGNDRVRAELHHRYRRILIDEFQDTDPVQLEIAVRLAADPDAAQPVDWRLLRPLPGRLFFVGDPKQSIYRFRRADIAQYLRAAGQLEATPLALTTNFRSTPAVLDWVNHTFGSLIVEERDAQPAYRALDRHRRDLSGTVTVLGNDPHDDGPNAEELRRREATEVAATIRRALAEGWRVAGEGAGQRTGQGTGEGQRTCRLGDMAILIPSRLPLAALRQALGDAGIPYQAENGSVVYATSEIRDLMLALQAIDDPADALALVSTLRSPLYACSDRDLYAWAAQGHRWQLDQAPVGAGSDDPVAAALASLRSLADVRHWVTPSELLGRLVGERRVLELALAGPGARDAWRRIRFVIDQARAWSDAGGVGLRNYLAWVRRQGEDGRYVAEAVLPETDIDAVRIMTIHAAKGLEFPITFVAGTTTRRRRPSARSLVWTERSWTLRSGSDYEAYQPIDELLGEHERLRLLYVACTRARDHLVVSLHRLPRSAGSTSDTSAAEELARGCAAFVTRASAAPPIGPPIVPAPPDPELPWADRATWTDERARVLLDASRPSTVSATHLVAETARPPRGAIGDGEDPGLDPGLLKGGVDLELPAWQRGRYGTSVGRAVHAVLQLVELPGAGNLDALCAAQAAAEGIHDRQRLIAALARSALACPIVRMVGAGAPSWRELFVAAPLGDTLLEGYVDLLVRTPDGLVLVDYKTDHAPDESAMHTKVVLYRAQLATYGLALGIVLGEPIVEARLVFCRPGGASEVTIPEWDEAQASLRRRLERSSPRREVAPPVPVATGRLDD